MHNSRCHSFFSCGILLMNFNEFISFITFGQTVSLELVHIFWFLDTQPLIASQRRMQEVLGKVSLHELFELWSPSNTKQRAGSYWKQGWKRIHKPFSSLPSLIKASCCHGLIIFTICSMGCCHGSIFTDYSTGCWWWQRHGWSIVLSKGSQLLVLGHTSKEK